jgi:hypothetical protein
VLCQVLHWDLLLLAVFHFYARKYDAWVVNSPLFYWCVVMAVKRLNERTTLRAVVGREQVSFVHMSFWIDLCSIQILYFCLRNLMWFHFRLKKSIIWLMLYGRKVNKIWFFELIADTRSEFLKVLLTDLLLICSVFKFKFWTLFLDFIKGVVVNLRWASLRSIFLILPALLDVLIQQFVVVIFRFHSIDLFARI